MRKREKEEKRVINGRKYIRKYESGKDGTKRMGKEKFD